MPFPWKKAKVTRITRMVADLQSPKRGGSLVVETGFPTSLIDLFVKNRDKLRRPSVKRKKKKSFYVEGDLCIGAPVIADEPVVVAEPEIAEPIAVLEPERESAPVAVAVAVTVTVTESPVPAKTEKRRAVESYFLAAVRVFVVTALALSTKKLAIGVTLSAFFLLFVEFVGKGTIVLLLRSFGSEKDDDDEDEFVAVRDLANLRSSSSSSEERDSPTVNSREDEIFRPGLEILSRGRKWGSLDSSSSGGDAAPVMEKSKSKRSKIRRKIIKNIVPKTLRKSKRWKKLKSVKTFEHEKLEEHEDEEEEAMEDSEEQEAEEVVELSVLGEEEEEEEEEEEAIREASWVVVVTVVVVLVGLVGGRFFSMLLTLIWCFAMKVVGIGRQEERSSS